MSLKSYVLFSTAALVASPMASAVAADYDPPVYAAEAPEYVPVEIGSGWYLRGDVSYSVNQPYEEGFVAATPGDAFSERMLPFSGTVGMGYHFTDYLRAELNVGFQPSQESSVRALGVDGTGAYQIDASAENSMFSGILSVYGDLGTYAGFTPYVGAGIGLVSSKESYNFVQAYSTVPAANNSFSVSERRYGYAYTIGAGIAYNVTDNLAVDVGYQYFSAPNSRYYELTSPSTYAEKKGISFHQIKVGLRYDLW